MKNDNLIKENRKLEEENENYRKDESALIQQMVVLSEVNGNFASKENQMRQEMAALAARNDNLASKEKEMRQQMAALAARNDNFASQASQMRHQMAALKQGNDKIMRESEKIETENDSLKDAIYSLQVELEKIRNELTQSQMEADHFRNMTFSAHAEINHIMNDIEEKMEKEIIYESVLPSTLEDKYIRFRNGSYGCDAAQLTFIFNYELRMKMIEFVDGQYDLSCDELLKRVFYDTTKRRKMMKLWPLCLKCSNGRNGKGGRWCENAACFNGIRESFYALRLIRNDIAHWNPYCCMYDPQDVKSKIKFVIDKMDELCKEKKEWNKRMENDRKKEFKHDSDW